MNGHAVPFAQRYPETTFAETLHHRLKIDNN
jgi:hypothetical protein